MACGSSPGGGRIFFPFFGPLVASLRSGYLKAVSTSCCNHQFSLSNAKNVIKEVGSIVGYFAGSITIIR